MNNQQKLEVDQEIDDKIDQEIESQYNYFPESSQKIFQDTVDSSYVKNVLTQ